MSAAAISADTTVSARSGGCRLQPRQHRSRPPRPRRGVEQAGFHGCCGAGLPGVRVAAGCTGITAYAAAGVSAPSPARLPAAPQGQDRATAPHDRPDAAVHLPGSHRRCARRCGRLYGPLTAWAGRRGSPASPAGRPGTTPSGRTRCWTAVRLSSRGRTTTACAPQRRRRPATPTAGLRRAHHRRGRHPFPYVRLHRAGAARSRRAEGGGALRAVRRPLDRGVPGWGGPVHRPPGQPAHPAQQDVFRGHTRAEAKALAASGAGLQGGPSASWPRSPVPGPPDHRRSDRPPGHRRRARLRRHRQDVRGVGGAGGSARRT